MPLPPVDQWTDAQLLAAKKLIDYLNSYEFWLHLMLWDVSEYIDGAWALGEDE